MCAADVATRWPDSAAPVEVSAQDSNVLVRPLGEPRLTLAQKLAAFDPALHGGEVMATRPVGNELL